VFVVTERHGVWGRARAAPGLAALGGDVDLGEVSCGAPGDCSVGGRYGAGFVNGVSIFQAFVISERDGVWRKVQRVPGLPAVNTAGNAGVVSVSCRARGECAAGGYFTSGPASDTAFQKTHAFVVSEHDGIWGRALAIPGMINQGGNAQIESVSCAAAGGCTGAGTYVNRAEEQQGFVLSRS
jgi:hypothetical protein